MKDNIDYNLYPLIAAILRQAARDYLELSDDPEYKYQKGIYAYTGKMFLDQVGWLDRAEILAYLSDDIRVA